METSPNINQIIWIGVKVSLNIKNQIPNANTALATEKITAHLPSHDQFLSAKSRKVLHIT